MNSTSFIASIPLIQSAICVSGDGGMQIKLAIPESEMGAAVGLLTMRGKLVRVTLETLETLETPESGAGGEKRRRHQKGDA